MCLPRMKFASSSPAEYSVARSWTSLVEIQDERAKVQAQMKVWAMNSIKDCDLLEEAFNREIFPGMFSECDKYSDLSGA